MGCFGDVKGEFRVFVLFARNGDFTTMGLHHLIDVVQSEAKT